MTNRRQQRVPRHRTGRTGPVPAVDSTAAGLEQSLRATHRGLSALLDSLRNAGLGEAVGPYEELQRVLRAQRQWALAHDRTELAPRWAEIAAVARTICAILEPFAATIGALRGLDPQPDAVPVTGPGPVTASGTGPGPVAGELGLARLFGGRLTVSARQLDRELAGLPWRADVERLVGAGVLSAHGWGRGLSYTLNGTAAEAVREHLLTVVTAAGREARP